MVREFGIEEAAQIMRAPGSTDSKYTRGVVGLLTGSNKYPGAAVLGVEGAAHAGAGYVRYVGPRRCQDMVLARRPETVLSLGACDSWVIGSGMESLADDDSRTPVFGQLLALSRIPNAYDSNDDEVGAVDPESLSRSDSAPLCVVDAGALEVFAGAVVAANDEAEAHSQQDMSLKKARWHFVVTPHSGELARILTIAGYSVTHAEIDASASSRQEWAAKAQDFLGCTVVLKGATTVIVPTEGDVLTVTSPTNWLATAGTGDVLAGIMGTVVAQSDARIASGEVSLAEAAATAVYAHGLAGVLAAQQDFDTGQVGHPIVALEVATNLPAAFQHILEFGVKASAESHSSVRTVSNEEHTA